MIHRQEAGQEAAQDENGELLQSQLLVVHCFVEYMLNDEQKRTGAEQHGDALRREQRLVAL